MQNTKQAVFMIGEEEYGMNIMDVIIIEKPMTVEPSAKLLKNLRGTIKLRGEIIPLYSLRRKFGLEDTEYSEDTRFVITASNGIRIAYEVDRVTEIVNLDSDQMSEVPEIVKNKDTTYMKAVTNLHDGLVILLDHEGILSEEEQKNIKEVLKK